MVDNLDNSGEAACVRAVAMDDNDAADLDQLPLRSNNFCRHRKGNFRLRREGGGTSVQWPRKLKIDFSAFYGKKMLEEARGRETNLMWRLRNLKG